LSARQGDGATLRQHLQRMAYASKKVDERLEAKPIYRAVAGLWDFFLALSATRRASMAAHALTMTDIEAYARLTGITLTDWELDVLIALDGVALKAAAKERKS